MLRSGLDHGRDGGRRLLRSACAGLLALAATAIAAQAQVALDRRVDYSLNQTGRLLDASPALGAGRYNYSRPVSPFMSGNPFAGGIMGQGMSLRSFSPIMDASQFRAPLGSSSLYAFRRDSVGVGEGLSPLGAAPYARPYYDASTTVTTPGMLQGLAGFPGTRAGLGRATDMRLPMRVDTQNSLRAQIVGLGQQPSLATSSSIFGTQTPRVPLPLTADQQPPWSQLTPGATPEGGLGGAVVGRAAEEGRGGAAALSTPLDAMLRRDLERRADLRPPHVPTPPPAADSGVADLRPGLIVPERSAGAPPAAAEGAGLRVFEAKSLPGFDTFTDMRLALALAANPAAPWYQEMQETLRKRPDLARDLQQRVQQDAAHFTQQMLTTPLPTFTGAGTSAVNEQMLKAEALLEIGHYYEAADRYDAAHLADALNPLPLIGKAHALLAAGDYRSAVFALVQGLERFPEVARFPLDLTKLMGGGEIVDIRRADLMQRLEQRESPELRFLLGYLEYHTGDREHGLANLEQAAREERSGSIIARYPELLRGQGVAPPPRIAPDPLRLPESRPSDATERETQ
jgi:tetratricopeptide (TPR) repeat protein